MLKINKKIEKILQRKEVDIKAGVKTILELLKEIQTQIIHELGQTALNSWNSYYLKTLLDSIESQIANFSIKAKSEISFLLEDSWSRGQQLVDEPLALIDKYLGFHLSTTMLDTYKDFAFHKLDGLAADAWDRIKGELTLGLLGGKTPQEVAKAIGRNLTQPSIFKSIAVRAEVITKTEMGRVFSSATQLRMKQASKYIEGLEKQWIHAGHPKIPRVSHIEAHGKYVPVDKPFNIGGIKMMYPRDPLAPLKEVINCGCDHIPYHKNWQ